MVMAQLVAVCASSSGSVIADNGYQLARVANTTGARGIARAGGCHHQGQVRASAECPAGD